MSLATLADLSQLLAEVFLEPDIDLGDDLREALAQLQGEGGSPTLLEPLARMAGSGLDLSAQPVEYARLFRHALTTDTIHLFESAQARGHLMAPAVIGPLQAIYDEADIAVQEDLATPPDHLGLELACLSYLLGQVVEGDLADRAAFVELAQRLLREHLQPFTAAVAEQLPQVAAHAYYLGAAELAVALVDEAGKALAEI